jgi:hypothetical protein
MQRLNRPTHAPLGTAFFLFVSLAIIPVSLKAAGLQLGFSPRLSAAIDIWRQFAEVFSPNTQAGAGSEVAALISSDRDPSTAAENQALPQRDYASDGEVAEVSRQFPEIPAVVAPAANTPRVASTKLAPRNQSRNQSMAKQGESNLAMNVERTAQVLRAFSADKAESAMRLELLNRFEKCIIPRGFDPNGSIKDLPIPKSFRMLIRLKQAAATSLTGAECKVRTALAPAGRFKLERASLMSTPAAPDNCDL